LASTATIVPERATLTHRLPQAFAALEKRIAVLCLLLVMLTLAFYNPLVHNEFINIDDNGYITQNSHIRSGLTWNTVRWAFTSFDDANWHPLTWLSHAFDYQIFKLNPAGHHYVNLLLHAANAVLLFLLLEAATGLTWPGFMVAGLFALHPINVESVAWAAERKNVLSMFFCLLAMHAYLRYARRPSAARYALVAVLFSAGLMAKPQIVTFPFLLLLFDYWPLRRMAAESSFETAHVSALPRSVPYLVVEKIPLLLLSAASAVITYLAQFTAGAMRTPPLRARIANAAVDYVRYIGKAFWPAHLAAFYPNPGKTLPPWQSVAAAAILIVITILVLRLRQHRYLAVGWFWFLGTLVPMIGLVQVGVQSIADRYAYLSFIGLFIAVVWAIAETARDRNISAASLALPTILVLATLGFLTSRQVGYWHDSVTLWRHTLAVTQTRNYFAHDALGHALADKGDVEGAIAEFNAAQSYDVYRAIDLASIAAYERVHGHLSDAMNEYARALDAAQDSASRSVILSELANAYLQLGDFARAKLSCDYAIKEDRRNGRAFVVNGLLAERDGDFNAAVASISQGVELQPSDIGYLLLAQAQRRTGNNAAADEAESQALRISHNIDAARQSARQSLAAVGIAP